MSTRYYPRYVKGNPQLRIFLPNWTMVMIKPTQPREVRFNEVPPLVTDDVPNNTVIFKVDPRMTDWDIKNYLEKIYKVSVAAIRSEILPGHLKRIPRGLTKLDDYKLARVSLPIGCTFEWPDLFPTSVQEEEADQMDTMRKELGADRALLADTKKISWYE